MKKVSLVLLFIGLVVHVYSQDALVNAALNIVNNHSFYDDPEANRTKENTVYSFLLNDNTKALLVFTTTEDSRYTCHACGANLSVFVFKKRSYSEWEITKQYIGNVEYGSWGIAPEKKNISSYLANGKILLIFTGSDMHQGVIESYLAVYTPINNKLSYIGRAAIGYDDTNSGFTDESNYSSWEAEYFIREKAFSYPEIILFKKGLKDGADYSKAETYVFDGTRYSLKQ